jgi:hypothetical protein
MSRSRSSTGTGQPPLSAVLGHGDLGGSLLYIFPLFVIYGVGVLSTPAMNGVDFVTRHIFAAVGYDKTSYLLLYAGLSLAFAAILVWMRKARLLHRNAFLPMVLESGILALTLGTLIVMAMRHLLGFEFQVAGPALALQDESVPTTIVLSLGAGVHEELVFRLGLFSGGAALLRLSRLAGHRWAMVISAIASSLIFSAAHHVGALGEPWKMDVFVYRSLAGLIFATLFYFRSLAHAVYTHALYDIYVGLIK